MRFGARLAPHPYFLPFFSDKIIRKRAKNIAYAGTLSDIHFSLLDLFELKVSEITTDKTKFLVIDLGEI